MDNPESVSALSILNCPLGFLYFLFVLCLVYSMLTGPLDCPFLILPSVFSNKMLEKTEWAIKNGQSRGTVNIEYTGHRS
jgi:hypothetical protein